jgi:hypothetical protein
MAKSARLGVIWAGPAQNSLEKGRHRGSRQQIWEISPPPGSGSARSIDRQRDDPATSRRGTLVAWKN